MNVFSSSIPCVSASRPELVGITRVTGSCVGVPFNATYHEPIIAMSGGAGVRYKFCVCEIPHSIKKDTHCDQKIVYIAIVSFPGLPCLSEGRK